MKLIISLLLSFSLSGIFAQKIILATYQYADNNRLQNIAPLAKYLSDSLGVPVDVRSYPTVHQFIVGIQKNEVDIALINTFGYFLLEASEKKYKMEPHAVLKIKEDARDNYKTAILARKDFPADSLSDLKKAASNARLGLVNIGSTSGNLMPRLKLNSVGISSPENAFKSVEYCKNHKNAIDMLLAGQVDVCAVGSTEYFNLLADSGRANLVKLLWLSPEIPLGPVLIHRRLDKKDRRKIITSLQVLKHTSPAVLEAVKSGWSEAKQAEEYVEINTRFYNAFKNQFGDIKAMEKILKQFAN